MPVACQATHKEVENEKKTRKSTSNRITFNAKILLLYANTRLIGYDFVHTHSLSKLRVRRQNMMPGMSNLGKVTRISKFRNHFTDYFKKIYTVPTPTAIAR
jgi:hypothetical protein